MLITKKIYGLLAVLALFGIQGSTCAKEALHKQGSNPLEMDDVENLLSEYAEEMTEPEKPVSEEKEQEHTHNQVFDMVVKPSPKSDCNIDGGFSFIPYTRQLYVNLFGFNLETDFENGDHRIRKKCVFNIFVKVPYGKQLVLESNSLDLASNIGEFGQGHVAQRIRIAGMSSEGESFSLAQGVSQEPITFGFEQNLGRCGQEELELESVLTATLRSSLPLGELSGDESLLPLNTQLNFLYSRSQFKLVDCIID